MKDCKIFSLRKRTYLDPTGYTCDLYRVFIEDVVDVKYASVCVDIETEQDYRYIKYILDNKNDFRPISRIFPRRLDEYQTIFKVTNESEFLDKLKPYIIIGELGR